MLKQFLKLFRNQDDLAGKVDHPHVDQLKAMAVDKTYFQFLAEKVLPGTRERLKREPGSDPVLVFAVGILEELFEGYWEEVDGALLDGRSPRLSPPPPPTSIQPPPPPGTEELAARELHSDSEGQDGADEDSDKGKLHAEQEEEGLEIGEESVVEMVEVGEEAQKASLPAIAEVEDNEQGTEAEDEVIDADAVAEMVEFGEGTGTGEEGLDEYGKPPSGFQSSLDATAEFEPPPIAREPVAESPWPKRLDEPTVLRGARTLLAVLTDNERLPIREQLSVPEVLMAADLWIHLIAQDDGVSGRIQTLARLVEQKFGSGQFSQARLLLRLFPANLETRINNDRQLYYEDMILRMGIRRRQKLEKSRATEISAALRGVELTKEDSLRAALRGLHEHLEVEMLLYTRAPEEVAVWQELASMSALPDVESYTQALMPPRCWRPLPESRDRDVRSILREHLVRPMAKRHVIAHMKTCYFILRAVGDTGLEAYLDSFFDWSQAFANVDATRYMAEIYKRTLASEEMVQEVFADLYERHYQASVNAALESLDDEALDVACGRAFHGMAESDFQVLAPGQFNLGGFVFDACLGFEYQLAGLPFRIHRLT